MGYYDKIVNAFNFMDNNRSYKIKDGCYLVKTSVYLAIAQKSDLTTDIDECANQCYLKSRFMDFTTENGKYLVLSCQDPLLIEQFSYMCDDFINDDPNVSDLIKSDPLAWWNKWVSMIGNTLKDARITGVLAELLIYLNIKKNGKNVYWFGSNRGVCDLESDDEVIEVKATENRYESSIKIAGQFQMDEIEKNKTLYLVRFELNPNGWTINKIIDKLNSVGVDRDFLELNLSALGYPKGRHSRDKGYSVIEARKYCVDDNFPKIIPSSFVKGVIPKGISKIEYSIDLDMVEYTGVDIDAENV